jgi:hypothetical protein
MDNEKPRKVGISEIIGDSTAIATKISRAAEAAMNGDKMMRQQERAMRAVTGSLSHAYSAMHEAAYSEARRIAEMLRPATQSFARQLAQLSEVGRRVSEAGLVGEKLRQVDAGMRVWQKGIEAAFPSPVLPLTHQSFSSMYSEIHKAFDFTRMFDADRIERMNHLESLVQIKFAAASLPERADRPIPLLPPRLQRGRPNAAVQFLNSFKQEYDEALKQAEEEGGQVIISSRTPSGDPIMVTQLTSVREYFVQVRGFDQEKRPRSFKANCGGLNLAIEILPIDEDLEEQNHTDEDSVN